MFAKTHPPNGNSRDINHRY